jgi:GNAT superfamily N-acetyltransferase
MLFADAALAGRVEAAECRLSVEIAAAVRARPGSDVVSVPIGGGAAVFTGPGAPINKVIGVGFAGAIAPADLDAVEQAFFSRRSPVRFEVATLADTSVGQLLTERGYRLVGFENVLGLQLAAVVDPAPAADLTVARLAQADTQVWFDVVVEGFSHPDGSAESPDEEFEREALRQIFDDFARSPAYRAYLCRWQGTPAGGAGMRLDAGIAQLAGAATLPEFRRRGVQAALFRFRLREAVDAGCDLAVVTTAPGSKSQHNAQRQGFELLYSRVILTKPVERSE